MWLSINPNSVSEAAKTIACEVLIGDEDRYVEEEDVENISARELARAFNVIDPEVTGLATAMERQWERSDALVKEFNATFGG